MASVAGADRDFRRTGGTHNGIFACCGRGCKLILKYGSFAHEQNDAAIAISRRGNYSGRGNLEYVRETWSIRGFLQAASQSALTTAINSMKAAYNSNGYDVGLYLDDGTTLTSHYMTSSQARGGVRVVALDFPEGEGAEYSTFRSYSITLEADFFNTTDFLLEYNETISFKGTGGPRRVFLETLDGIPQEQIGARFTTYKAMQRGSSIAFGNWPNFPPPIWPAAELLDQREVNIHTPTKVDEQYFGYGIDWSYTFESTSPLQGRPTLR